jgi:predicted NAD/FAD-binding protein
MIQSNINWVNFKKCILFLVNNNMNSKKIGIIGAGIGGLSAGLLLSKKGYNVTIFEKENIIG